MFNIVTRGHDTADGTLIKVQHTFNHPPLLRRENLTFMMVRQHCRGFGIQFGIFFLPAQQPHYRFGGALAQSMVG